MVTSEKRKIILVGPMHPYRGGIAHFLDTMFEGLQRRGHDVDAVTFRRQYPELLFPGRSQFEVSTGEADAAKSGQRIIDSVNPISWFAAGRYVAEKAPDIVVYHYWMPFFGPAFGTIARKVRASGVEQAAIVHNAIPHERRPGDLVFGRYFLNSVDRLITMSSSVTGDLAKIGCSQPVVQIHHPVYHHFGAPVDKGLARQSLQLPDDAPTILFFGFIRKYKGLHVLLESLSQVLDALPDLRVMVAGEFYDDETFYREIIEREGLADAVQLHANYIPTSEVARYFSAADVVVQPYVSATQSGVAQIAFHFNRPVIVTDVGGLAETVPHEKAGLVVPPENPRKLAEAVIRYFAEDMEAELTAGVKAEKLKYSWDRLYEVVEW